MDIRSLSIVVGWFVFVTFGTILLDRYFSTKWALLACLFSIVLLVLGYYEDIVKWAPSHKFWFLSMCVIAGALIALMSGELLLQLSKTVTNVPAKEEAQKEPVPLRVENTTPSQQPIPPKPHAKPHHPTPSMPAVGPRIGSGPDAYKDVSDVQVGQWAMETADKIEEMASDFMKSGAGPGYQALVLRFSRDFKTAYFQDITDLRTEILKRLGPDGKDLKEISAWHVLNLENPPGWPERISPVLVKDYAPYLRRLGLRLKRRAIPRNHPLALQFSEQQIAPSRNQFPYRILVTINTKTELSAGYIVVEVKGPMASIGCDFQGSKPVASPQFVDNKELAKLLARGQTSDSLVYALQIGDMPLTPSAPIHVEAEGGKEFHVSRVTYFEE